MIREEERNTIAHKIAWETSKHYDPLLSKESWCEMAARDAIDWADSHLKKELWDSEKVIKWLRDNADSYTWYNEFEGESGMTDDFIEDLRKAMED